MTGNRTVLGLRWGGLESRRITDLPLAGMLALRDLGPADGTGPSQTQQQLALQRPARLDEQGLVDGLVRHPASVILRTAELLPASDLLGRPVSLSLHATSLHNAGCRASLHLCGRLALSHARRSASAARYLPRPWSASIPARSIAARAAVAPNSLGGTSTKLRPNEPIAVRADELTTTLIHKLPFASTRPVDRVSMTQDRPRSPP